MIGKLWGLVQEKARPKFLLLFCLVSIGGAVELLGIASTADLMGLVASKGESKIQGPLGFVLNLSDVSAPEDRLKYGLLTAILILAFSHSYSIARTYTRAQFVWIQDLEIASRLFRTCLHRPYSWFLQRNTGELHRILSSGHVTQQVLGSFLTAVSHFAVAVTLMAALIYTDPTVAFVGALVVFGAYGMVRLYTRKTLHQKGREAHRADEARRITAQEALTSIRFVKTTAREDFFTERYSHYAEEASRGMVFHSIYVDTVRAFLEWVTIASILTLSVVMVMGAEDLATLLPRLTLYTMAGYRVVPAVHELFGLWSRLKFESHLLEKIEALLDLPDRATHEEGEKVAGLENPKVPLLAVKDLTYEYEGANRQALHGVSLELHRGQWIGVVGTTGAGKTTLLDLMSGLCFPTGGEIRVGESVLNKNVVRHWQSRIGVVPQEVILLDDSVLRNVAFGVPCEEIDEALVLKVCEMAGLSKLLQQLPNGLETRLGERGARLSGGERQRMGLARALYRKPLLLLLDEATSALDQATEARIIDTLQELSQECTMVTVAHRLSSVQPCDTIYVLEEGKVVSQGDFDTLLDTSAHFKRLALAT